MTYTIDELYTDLELDGFTLPDLLDIAKDWEIDLGGAKLKKDVLTAVKLFFAAERAKAQPAKIDDLIDSPSFKPIDKDGKDIKAQFKVRNIDIWKRNGKAVMQRSIIPPDGWTGSTSDVE